jgi:hypothetical protein
MTLDPPIAGQGTSLLIGVDGGALTSGSAAAASLTFSLPRGMRVDRASRSQLCAAAPCPPESRIGFGRYVLNVQGFLPPAGSTQLVWSIDAFLARPTHAGDAAAVRLVSTLLGADSVAALVVPLIGTPVPTTSTVVGRFVPRASGPYGLDLRLPSLPAQLRVAAPVVVTPAGFELSLTAVRRVRKTIYHQIRVPTATGGWRTQRVRDHELVGHDLLRTPSSCPGTWPYALRVGFPGSTRTTSGRLPCSRATGPLG